MKNLFLAILLVISCPAAQSQKHLPKFKYSKEPAVIKGCFVGDSAQMPENVRLIFKMKYHSGTGDALRGKRVALDNNGCVESSIPSGTPVECQVGIDDRNFTCFITPGDTASFTLDLRKLNSQGLTEALSFEGALADFNHDLVYAQEQGFDPHTIFVEINRKANMGQLAAELPEHSVDGYFQYLDSTFRSVDKLIDDNRVIGDAYREFAKAVNSYEYAIAIPYCAYSIRHAGLDTEEAYDALAERIRNSLECYLKDDPLASPILCYNMSGEADFSFSHYSSKPIKIAEDYRQCHLATKYMKQIAQQSQLLSEAQKDSVAVFMPELGQNVLDFNEKLEKELSFINEQGKSRICTLPEDKKNSDDILSVILEPYHGRPVLIDLWETTCGSCRLAFKNMHEKKNELYDRIHFVNIASEQSDADTWERLVPSYIGDHYRLSNEQLKALHRQLPCDTSGVPVWLFINSDGSIHHTFVGGGDVKKLMNDLEQFLQ